MRIIKRGKCNVLLLDGDEIATAVRAYLVAHSVYAGPVTTVRWETPDDETTECAIIVDAGSRLIVNGKLVVDGKVQP